jgi:hypothetical protein
LQEINVPCEAISSVGSGSEQPGKNGISAFTAKIILNFSKAANPVFCDELKKKMSVGGVN